MNLENKQSLRLRQKTLVISLTLSLDHWKPKIWRRIWVKDNIRLDKLCGILYSSMGWGGYHLSEIKTKTESYGDMSVDPPDDLLDWKKYTLRDILNENLTKFKYYYDFGDNWEMTVVAKIKTDLDLDAPYPVCVSGANAAPPEDVGSYSGYGDFIKVMNGPKNDRYKELKEWYGERTFDPKHFSVDETNDFLYDFLPKKFRK